MQPPTPTTAPQPGVPETVAKGVVRVLAPNPSPMTYWGTNTYLLGTDTVAVIDPGPQSAPHLDALLRAIRGRPVTHILVTHSHLDHSPLSRDLSRITGAPVLAFGDSNAGRSAIMQDVSGAVGGGEGVDAAFEPDEIVCDGQTLTAGGRTITALHTPGHFGNHLCYETDDIVFTGDLVMGWATSLVSPPDGDLTDFMTSCRRLADLGSKTGLSGHGAPIADLSARIETLLAHRTAREDQIRAALTAGAQTARALTELIYTDVPTALLPMAERNVLAHLIDLTKRDICAPLGALSAAAKFSLLTVEKT
ncbi:MBL fold metallo-hydrolase [Pseudooctadecabacter jejudonensis]|uniref:Putative metallo-hydrolase n=1 Tax=Pseudooctadecabacter jejudonensis TaxID=1391910 RepID=A0A1Y5R768_9RHOB|nr:MBL fold metallo-hydrolase [Pseudooctadecabacter jejudonensis]SLN10786.1 putative metallo-hydrolase [Pseudooctadecabacter jejudonensis]